jgi:hypothetical protein
MEDVLHIFIEQANLRPDREQVNNRNTMVPCATDGALIVSKDGFQNLPCSANMKLRSAHNEKSLRILQAFS